MKYRYQLQIDLKTAQKNPRPMYAQWSLHETTLFKNIKSWKKATAIYKKLSAGAKLVDKRKKLAWEKK